MKIEQLCIRDSIISLSYLENEIPFRNIIFIRNASLAREVILNIFKKYIQQIMLKLDYLWSFIHECSLFSFRKAANRENYFDVFFPIFDGNKGKETTFVINQKYPNSDLLKQIDR